MSSITLNLDERLAGFAEAQATRLGLNSAADYLVSLLSREQKKVADIRRVESELRAGLESGGEIEANDHFWEKKRSELLARHKH